LELGCVTALDEETVGVVAFGQRDWPGENSSLPKGLRQAMRGALTTAVAVGVKGHIDLPGRVAELLELARIEMDSQRASQVAKAGLPQGGVVEETFYQDQFGT
jgi:hypothetical protein